jgi:replicative DNA helicase
MPACDDYGHLLTLHGTWAGWSPPEGRAKKYSLQNPGQGGQTWEATKRVPVFFDRARRAGHRALVAVEGPIDAAIAQARGDTRVVALVGALVTDQQIRTLQRHKIASVAIVLDPDKAGDANIARNVERLLAAGIDAYVAPRLPDGVDPNEFVVAHGIDEWRRLIDKATHGLRFVAEQILKQHKPATGWTDQATEAAVRQTARWAAGCVPEGPEDALRRFFVGPILQELGGNADELVARVRLERKAKVQANGAASAGSAGKAEDNSADDQHGDAWEGGDEPPPEEPDRRVDVEALEFRYRPVTSAMLANGTPHPEWLVRGILVKGQPGIIGGPRKSLKTSLLVDLAVSLATATPFLRHFRVERPVRVMLLSGESGEWTLPNAAANVCTARGLRLADLGDRLLWQFDLPQLASDKHMELLRAGLRRDRVEVVITDPLYLSLLAGPDGKSIDPANVFSMGPLLGSITRTCLSAGATPLFSHHGTKPTSRKYEPLELDDLAYSGTAEFSRQWILVSRRKRYEAGTGKHELFLHFGGSCGQSRLYCVDIDEGVLGEDFGGKKWEVEVATGAEFYQGEKGLRAAASQQKRDREDRANDAAVLAALDRLDEEGTGVGLGAVRTEARLSRERYDRALARLRGDGLIEDTRVAVTVGHGATRGSPGIRRRGHL